jgi:hypothetical protein
MHLSRAGHRIAARMPYHTAATVFGTLIRNLF